MRDGDNENEHKQSGQQCSESDQKGGRKRGGQQADQQDSAKPGGGQQDIGTVGAVH